jgi:hypothetical protein
MVIGFKDGDNMLISMMDSEIKKMLKKDGRMEIKVTAAYDTTICGYCENRFITILNRGKRILPMSIVTLDKITGSNYKPGDFITISRRYEDDFIISNNTSTIDMVMPASENLDSVEVKYRNVREFLSIQAVPSYGMLPIIARMVNLESAVSLRDADILMKTYIMEQISLILLGLKGKQDITAKNIIGYGVGLTPSADDFLLGMLSVLDHYNEASRRNILSKYIEKYSHTTTEVSSWMLSYASKQKQYPHIVIDYFAHSTDKENFLAEFLKHGSSSGMDMMCGILCGLNILRKEDH